MSGELRLCIKIDLNSKTCVHTGGSPAPSYYSLSSARSLELVLVYS